MPDLGINQDLIGVPGSRALLTTPALVLDLDALEANIATMAEHCRRTGQALRPHAKTHKSIEVAKRQIAAGAVGICCATLGEAEAMVLAGIPGVHVTSPVIRPRQVERLIGLARRAPDMSVVADHPANVAVLAEAAAAAGVTLRVMVDLDVGSKRTGVVSAQEATAVARAVAAAPSLTLAGLQAYGGFLQHIHDYDERRREAKQVSDFVAQVAAALEAEGLAPLVVTGGGTGTHDMDHGLGAFGELQAGSYTVMDVDYDAVALKPDGTRPFRNALFVQASVVSTSHDGFVTIDAGLKAFATDGPKPVVAAGAPHDATFGFAGDEHGKIFFPEDGPRLALGDIVECVVPHCDPTVNLYDVYHVVKGDTLVDIWPVDARGKR